MRFITFKNDGILTNVNLAQISHIETMTDGTYEVRIYMVGSAEPIIVFGDDARTFSNRLAAVSS